MPIMEFFRILNGFCLIICIVMKTNLSTQPCVWSSETIKVVSSCPANVEETYRAARIKKCIGIGLRQNCTSPQQFEYHCLYSLQTNSLVEVCAAETLIHGVCLVYNAALFKLDLLEKVKCTDFPTPCPDRYVSTNAHLDAPCYKFINLTSSLTSNEEKTDEINSADMLVWISLATGFAVLFCTITITAWFLRKRKVRKQSKGKIQEYLQTMIEIGTEDEGSGGKEERAKLICDTSGPEKREHAVIETDIQSEPEKGEHCVRSPQQTESLGHYNIWRTKISDQFSTLTDDEVLVLFCFLCFDSGPPDFTDTEWMDLLKKIREIVYRKGNPVTSEEAQQTLDRLKSRDYLWEDQDTITKDAKDETMYWIASRNCKTPFFFSSYETAKVYLRSMGYNRKSGEKCVISDWNGNNSLLKCRLQMNILTHVTMEDSSIYDGIYPILNVSNQILNDREERRKKNLTELKESGETVHYRGRSWENIDHVKWLWRYGRPDIVRSCIGLHPHWDIYVIDNKAYRKPSIYLANSSVVRCLLYALLSAEKYQLNLKRHLHNINKIRNRYFPDITEDMYMSVNPPDGITTTNNGVLTFISDDIRHDVMYAFVTECLVEDSDLEFFLTTASRDVISEYCRSWGYKRRAEERCLYIPRYPQKMYDLLIDKLQLDIISHCTVSDEEIHDSISERLRIPEEVLKGSFDERKRFVDQIKEDDVYVYRARCIIVGCAGAGKTTVLRNLKRRKGKEDIEQPTETTIGLDVHQDLFLIEQSKDGSGSTLFDYEDNTSTLPLENYEKHLLSVMDFAGQVAYYACHQVYLSHRAIYLIVVDMTQDLNAKLQQDDRNCVQGTLFEEWTALDYFTFWLQTIRTYGKEDSYKRKPYSTTSREHGKILMPIIVLATHADSYKKSKVSEEDTSTYGSFFAKLRKHLPENFKNLVCKHFELELPPQERSDNELRDLEKVRCYIANTAISLPHWGERVPKKWSDFENIIREKRQELKISSLEELKELSNYILNVDFEDMLKFHHDIGLILYFPDLGNDVILDIQWFVDAFKYIITDRRHVSMQLTIHEDWDQYYDDGMITESLMFKIWEEKIGNNSPYVRYLNRITPFMERLGIIAKIGKRDRRKNQCYYVPSMNKRQLKEGDEWTRWKKTQILSFYFKTYLPHFFFFRLVVACFSLLDTQEKEFYKNIALFHGNEKEEYHTVAIAVNKTSIQLQVLTPAGKDIPLRTDRTRAIRFKIEKKIAELTKTFHGNVDYEIGFPCSCEPIFITEEDERRFISEKELLKISAEYPPCPRCKLHSDKRINKKELWEIWGKCELQDQYYIS